MNVKYDALLKHIREADAVVNIAGGLTPKGAYDNATDYAVGDSVDYLGSSYVMYVDAVAGTLPTDTAKWQVISNKGDKGETGLTGNKGDKGDTGTGITEQAIGFTLTGGTTPKTLTVALDANVSGNNTGDQDLSGYELLSNKQTDLTASATKYPTVNAVNTGLGLKEDKVAGKGLSANDFTDAFETKLTGIETLADVTDATNVAAAGAVMTETDPVWTGDKASYSTKTVADGLYAPISVVNYTLPTAAAAVLGGVKVGSRLSIAAGVLSADVQTTDISGKQDALSGTGFVKIAGTTISYDNSTYLTSLSGAVLVSQATPQTVGDTTNRLLKLWATDITVTNTITGSVTGNAGTVTTNANLTGVITSVGNATSIASQTGTGTKFVVDTSPTIVTPTITTSAVCPLIYGSSADNGNITIEGTSSATKTTSYVILQSTGGNVGIGTTSPTGLLEIAGSGGVTKQYFNYGSDVTGYSGMYWRSAADSFTGALVRNQVDGSFNLFTDNSGSVPRFTVLDGGNVGIGTTGPDAKLDCLSLTEQLRLTYTDGTVYTSFTTSSGGDLTIAPSGGDTTITGNLSITGVTTIGNASADTVTANAATWTFANDTSFVLSGGVNGLYFDGTTLSIDSTNNRIGIGTAAPTGKLHIVGASPAAVGTTPGTAADDTFLVSGGIGGETTIATTGVGGTGADFNFTAGAGGLASAATTSSTGGAGGTITMTSGTGGAASETGIDIGGVGGTIALLPGTGGAATVGTSSTGGAGGPLKLYGGKGGTGTTAAGAGGLIRFYVSTTSASPLEVMRIGSTAVTVNVLNDATTDFTVGTNTYTSIFSDASNDSIMIMNNALGKVGFFGETAVVKPTALTTALTTITVAAYTIDTAIQAVTSTLPFGFVNANEGNTVVASVRNLMLRVAELELKLQNLGLIS